MIFDPHCKHLPAISAANPGKKINFVTHDLNSTLTDQAAPYHLFGCNLQQHFAGTLFRFPLRTQEQANKSTISKQVGAQGRTIRRCRLNSMQLIHVHGLSCCKSQTVASHKLLSCASIHAGGGVRLIWQITTSFARAQPSFMLHASLLSSGIHHRLHYSLVHRP